VCWPQPHRCHRNAERPRVAALQDFTRAHSQAGIITKLVYEYYGDKVKDILPALGSHVRSCSHCDARTTQLLPLMCPVSVRLGACCTTQDPMTISATDKMFEGVPHELFRVHDWRNDVVTLGTVPAEFVSEITDGKYSHEYPVQVNKMVRDGGHDLVISIGQVVPHEVAGMANHTKNILVRSQSVWAANLTAIVT
jgi:nickel-dependent lactate racemase